MKRHAFKETVDYLKTKKLDYTWRSIPFLNGAFGEDVIDLFYISQLTDRVALKDCIIKPLVQHCSSPRKRPIDAQTALDSMIYADDCMIESDAGKIEDYILSGMV